jgi:hypothetical protein
MADFLRTQGTSLYFIYNNTVHEVECSGISGIGGSRNTQTIQTLKAESATIIAGAQQPGTPSFSIYINNSETQAVLQELYQNAETVEWLVGLSDGDVAAEPGVINGARSWLTFRGFVTDFPFEFSVDTVVESSITIQMRDKYTFMPKDTSGV